MFNQFESQTTGTVIRGPVEKTLNLDISMLGKHNLENARCAFQLCMKLGLDETAVREAIHHFKGIERRLEVAGSVEGITVIDDYAHNPAKIAAALSAVAQTVKSVHAFWRPHGFTPLFQFQDELLESFAEHWNKQGGSIFILPVYYAGGTVTKKMTAGDFVERLNALGIPAKLVPDYSLLKHKLEQCATAGDAILGMGARDPELPLFSKKLVAEWKKS
jgi:UDP-N-acetylmuramate--alanine ligase